MSITIFYFFQNVYFIKLFIIKYCYFQLMSCAISQGSISDEAGGKSSRNVFSPMSAPMLFHYAARLWIKFLNSVRTTPFRSGLFSRKILWVSFLLACCRFLTACTTLNWPFLSNFITAWGATSIFTRLYRLYKASLDTFKIPGHCEHSRPLFLNAPNRS